MFVVFCRMTPCTMKLCKSFADRECPLQTMQRAVFWLIKIQEAVSQEYGTQDKTRCLLSLFWTHWLCWCRWSTQTSPFHKLQILPAPFFVPAIANEILFKKRPILIARKHPLISTLTVFQATVYSFLLVPALSLSHALSWLFTNLQYSLNMHSGSLGLCFAKLNQDSCLTMLFAALSAVLRSSFLKMDKQICTSADF